MSRPLVPDRALALYGGIGLWLAGTVLLWDYYRGRSKPWPLRIAGAVL